MPPRNGSRIHSPLAVLIKHVNPTAQDGKLQGARHGAPGGDAGKAEERADDDINEKPDNEQIEALERMEADEAIFPFFEHARNLGVKHIAVHKAMPTAPGFDEGCGFFTCVCLCSPGGRVKDMLSFG